MSINLNIIKRPLLLLAAIITLFTSCSKDPEAIIPEDTLKAISFSGDSATLYVGQNLQIPFFITPTDYNKALLLWSSSDPTVISISDLGVVNALKAGKSVITVANTKTTVSGKFRVTVINRIDSVRTGLIAYYMFNNNSADSSGHKYDGINYSTSNVSNRFGQANGAYYFNGTSSYINVKDAVPLRLNNTDFTINMWVKLDAYDYTYGSAILSKRGAGSNNGWLYGVHGATSSQGILVGQTTFQVSGGNDPFAAGLKNIDTGGWFMLSAVFSLNTRLMTFYVNGALDSVTTLPLPYANATSDLFIGKDNPAAGGLGYYFKGALDEVRIYGRALPVTDIQKLYALPF